MSELSAQGRIQTDGKRSGCLKTVKMTLLISSDRFHDFTCNWKSLTVSRDCLCTLFVEGSDVC